MTEIKELADAVNAAQEWIGDLQRHLDWHDRNKVYHVLLAALHALRDTLQRDEAIRIGAQLPPLLRGLYYEGWHPGARAAFGGRTAFLDRVHDGVHRDPAVDAEQVVRGVLAVLAARLPAAELENAKAATPRSLHNLWPN